MQTTTRISSIIQAELDELVAIRHDLHQHPELSYKEVRTSGVVRRELERLGVEHIADLAGGTGVLAHLPATGANGSRAAQAVALRADMDALPIDEQTGVAYASQNEGVMHACGHDGHTTMLLGAVRVLRALDERPNPVTFIFQPAEEGGAGAKRMCEEGALEGSRLGPPVRSVFGLHGWPDLALGHVTTRPGPLLAAVDVFRVNVLGEGSHAAYPHTGADPVVAAAQCVTALQTIVSRNVDPVHEAVCTVAGVHAGRVENVIPDRATFFGTVRTHSDAVRELVRSRFHALVEQTCAAMGCRADIEWSAGYPVTKNDPALTQWFFDLARETLGADRVSRMERPHMGGEDFAYYGERLPSVFFMLGLRPGDQTDPPMLHQPTFNFNDDAIATGVEMLCRIALSSDSP